MPGIGTALPGSWLFAVCCMAVAALFKTGAQRAAYSLCAVMAIMISACSAHIAEQLILGFGMF